MMQEQSRNLKVLKKQRKIKIIKVKTEINERQYKRFIVLLYLYEKSKAITTNSFNLKELAASKGIKNGIFEEAYDYLYEEKLIEGSSSESIFLTHLGKKAIEYTVNYPEERTIHFSSYKDMDLNEN